ncbi:MAG: DUF418 domain-containing protein [Pseudoxanthomonas sp.]
MNAAPVPLAPVGEGERLPVLDVARGFALLGILLMNMEGFFGPPVVAVGGLDPALRGADRWADAAIYILVQGKFYALFSLLFGMGFAVMGARADAAGRRFDGLYLRRSGALLGIGLGHALLLWSGDVLASYALLSLPLLVLGRRLSRDGLLALAAYLFVLVPLLLFALGLFGSMQKGTEAWRHAVAAGTREYLDTLQAQRQAYGQGGWMQATAQRVRDLGQALCWLPLLGLPPLAMFLLGAWGVRAGVLADPARWTRLYAALRQGALPLGLALMLASFALAPATPLLDPDLREGTAAALARIASGSMCLGYFAWLARALQSPAWAPRLAWLAPAGRMALSNYLLQSLLCTSLAYGYGLGLFGRVPRAWQVVLALALYALQLLASRWWLARFRFGPAEWLWRSLTYLRPQPMRRAAPAGA